MKRFFVLLIVLSAQLSLAQVDRVFWFAAPEVTSQHADRPVYLHLTSFDKATEVTISLPANPQVPSLKVNLKANEAIAIQLGDRLTALSNIENTTPNTVEDKGLLVQSDQKISAYYEVRGSLVGSGVVNTDIFTLKGEKALGTDFYTPFQSGLANYVYTAAPNSWSTIDIVATEDNTTVTIRPKVAVLGHEANVSFVISLDRGQTYSVRGLEQDASYTMSGTHITSTKRIAVTVKDDSVILPIGGSWDLIGDQLVPVEYLGLAYLVTEGRNVIVATEDGTTIEYSSNSQLPFQVKNLNAGETFQINKSSLGDSDTFVLHIKADKPVYVFSVQQIGTEFSGALIPTIECTGSKKINFTRASDEELKLEFFFKTGAENDFYLDGVPLDIVSFNKGPIASTSDKWSYAYKSFSADEIVPETNVTIENRSSEFHLGVLNGSSITGAQYGFFTSFSGLELGADQFLCGGDSLVLDAGIGRDAYLWDSGETSRQLVVKESGEYIVSIIEGRCRVTDTIAVTFNPTITVDLGVDRVTCLNSDTLLDAGSASSYLWTTGDTLRSLIIKETGAYGVAVANEFGCTDSTGVTLTALNAPLVDQEAEVAICNEAVYDVAFNNERTTYAWYQDGAVLDEVSGVITLVDEGFYKVIATNQCGSDSSSFILRFWDVEIPNVVTPNGDGKNERFVVSGIDQGVWEFQVYNRWGQRVYRTSDFQNSWVPDLADGTYFYYLKHEAICNEFKGWIQVLR